jgi:hypothetical protein
LCGAISFVLLISGCLAPSHANRCDPVSGADRDGCLRETATWYQEPETCYGIGDTTIREACLRDSVNPEAAQRLIETRQALGRSSLTTPTPSSSSNKSAPPAPAPKPSPPPSPGTTQSQIADCMTANKMSQDACTQEVAISKRDLLLCGSIAASDIHTHCIFAIASASKDPASCSVLSGDDRQLCAYYAKGG